jgi:nucleotide-binding universal stress UspA family protein
MATVETSVSKEKRSVLLPVDGSDCSDRAVKWYMKNMHKADDEVLLFYAVEFPSVPFLRDATADGFSTDAVRKLVHEKTEEVKKMTLKYEEMMKGERVVGSFHARDGDKPGQNIARFAKEKHVDCIVIGSRGQGAVRRTLLGSISDYVLHHSKVTVVVVPPPAADGHR